MTAAVMDIALAKTLLPKRRPGGAKWDFGRLLCVSGSASMPGAAALCCMAASRSGVGLVRAASVGSVLAAVAANSPECTQAPMPTGSGGGISSGALPVLAAEAARATAVVIGPGLGIDDDTRELVRGMTGCGSPLVLDADALNIIARMPDIRFAPDTIITPHIVELSRLSGLGTGEIAASPLKAASDFAVRRGVTVVLKGPASFIAAPDGRAMVNIRDNTGLGKGGSGDVLAGLIGGLLAQNAPAFEAAACGVYLHSLAGALARRDLGAYAMTPRDVIERLPEAFTQVSGE